MTLALLSLLADDAPPAPNPMGLGGMMPMMILLFVMMYFMLIRPQKKRQQEQEQMQKAMAEGDRVVTLGGVHGVIASVREQTLIVRIADNVKVEFDKAAIVRVTKKDAEPAKA